MGELKYDIGDEVRISIPGMRLEAKGIVRDRFVTTYDVEFLDGPWAGKVRTIPEYFLNPIGDTPQSPSPSEDRIHKTTTHIIFPDESVTPVQTS